MANNGGPAFPATIPIEHSDDQGKDYLNYAESGMTLRDYFAAKAMAVYLTDPALVSGNRVAELAYKMADAMLKAREV